jgi:hypothetical protein
MTLSELYHIRNTLHDNWDFISSNTDSDESGIREEMSENYGLAKKSLDKEIERIQLINAKARAKRSKKS